MSRLTQIIQNTFIRVFAFTSVIFKSIVSFFQKIFGFFGLSQPDYFLDADNAQTAKRSEAKQRIETNQPAIEKRTATSDRRKSNDRQMDYYLKMASEIQKK